MTESFINKRTDENSEQRCVATTQKMDVFIGLFQKFNQEIYKSYSMLDLVGKHVDINHFTYPENVVEEYKENGVGECVISNVDFVPQNHCHIFNVKK